MCANFEREIGRQRSLTPQPTKSILKQTPPVITPTPVIQQQAPIIKTPPLVQQQAQSKVNYQQTTQSLFSSFYQPINNAGFFQPTTRLLDR